MKHILYPICIFILTCITTKGTAQLNTTIPENNYFEGRIIYDLSYVPKTNNISKEQASILFGDKQVFTIKDDMYKNEMNGALKMTQHYLGNDTLFISTTQSKELLWVDVTKINDEIIDTEITENVEVINGITCNLLTITSNKGYYKYYYNTSYKINYQYYINHKVGYWDISALETKSLMIKGIKDTKEEHVELIAVDIQNTVIDETEFKLPNYTRKRFPIKYDK